MESAASKLSNSSTSDTPIEEAREALFKSTWTGRATISSFACFSDKETLPELAEETVPFNTSEFVSVALVSTCTEEVEASSSLVDFSFFSTKLSKGDSLDWLFFRPSKRPLTALIKPPARLRCLVLLALLSCLTNLAKGDSSSNSPSATSLSPLLSLLPALGVSSPRKKRSIRI